LQVQGTLQEQASLSWPAISQCSPWGFFFVDSAADERMLNTNAAKPSAQTFFIRVRS
jgi:hypothetical protein